MNHRLALLVALALGSLSAGENRGLAAQSGDWPTLSGAGLEFLSQSGLLQITLSGQLDIESAHVGNAWTGLAEREEGEAPLPADHSGCPACHVGMAFPGEGGDLTVHRLRMFADVFLGDHVYSLVEFRTDRGHAPSDGDVEARIEQAYVRVGSSSGSMGVQLGRFASPFGAYALRHMSTVDPFLRPPLPYDYRTVMSRTMVASDVTLLLPWRDSPQIFRKPGAPPVWDVPYQWGAMAFGRVGPVEVRVAAMNSAPSSDPEAWDWNRERMKRPSWVVAARTHLSASFDLGASYNRGPWMEDVVAGTIAPLPGSPPGTVTPSYQDFDQELASLDVGFARGPLMVRAEAMLDRWEVPNILVRATERLYTVEAQADVRAGIFLAARVGYIDFRPLPDSAGGARDWDFDVLRYEGSIGYRLVRNAGVLLSAFRQTQTEASDGDTNHVGVRLWWAF